MAKPESSATENQPQPENKNQPIESELKATGELDDLFNGLGEADPDKIEKLKRYFIGKIRFALGAPGRGFSPEQNLNPKYSNLSVDQKNQTISFSVKVRVGNTVRTLTAKADKKGNQEYEWRVLLN